MMHPRFLARTKAIERDKRGDIYRALDRLLATTAELCRQSGLDDDGELDRQREILATIAVADRLSADALVNLSAKLLADARAIVTSLRAADVVFAAVEPTPFS